uniref:Putative positive regulator of mannosylphosphate transferase n=1 Tax=Ogataea minuta TaxID=36026 RepID=D0FYF9_9ASCO|nr:putative positive regulator of mannosylphosphate transferase [Ogataea minuta]
MKTLRMFPRLPGGAAKLVPRRRKCVLLLVLVCLMQLLMLNFYESQTHLDMLNEVSEFLKMTSLTTSAKDFVQGFEHKLRGMNLSLDYNRYWKFYKELNNSKLRFNVNTYQELRKQKHLFDPRITYSVYLNYIRKQYEAVNPWNVDDSEDTNVRVPFSWQDWVDLSALNKYLVYSEEEKPTCKDIITKGIDYSPDRKVRNLRKQFDKTCVDNAMYQGPTSKHLLPGFNFVDRAGKRTFLEKKIHAKSYLLSGAPIPNSIIFLTENGTYEVYPEEDRTMMDSGLYQDYVKENQESEYIADPINELRLLTRTIPARKPELDFDEILVAENNYQYTIPIENFKYDYKSIIKDYESRMDTLTRKEVNHLNSLKYSESLSDNGLFKSFKEVNLNWPASYQGHKLQENGGHYDYRFFNGLLTESKINEFDDINEKRKIILHRMIHTWLQFTYKEGIVSFIAHGSLLSWYWDGLVFEWDNDIDVQMPIMDLDKFSLRFNNSMIVEDLTYGYGKYFIDCGSFPTHRKKGNGKNNIDARFIDVDNGLYIDITGLALTDTAKLPARFEREWRMIQKSAKSDPLVEEKNQKDAGLLKRGLTLDTAGSEHVPREDSAKKDLRQGVKRKVSIAAKTELPSNEALARNEKLQIYNCRNNHFYSYSELSPVRLSMMEGAPCFVPSDFAAVLKSEYSSGLKRFLFNKHLYLQDLRFWIPVSLVQAEVRKISGSSVRLSKMMSFYKEHEVEMLLKLLEEEEVLKEFFLTFETTSLHTREMELLAQINGGDESKEKEYRNLIASYKSLRKPIRKDLFNYLNELDKLQRSEKLILQDYERASSQNEGFYYVQEDPVKKPLAINKAGDSLKKLLGKDKSVKSVKSDKAPTEEEQEDSEENPVAPNQSGGRITGVSYGNPGIRRIHRTNKNKNKDSAEKAD